jgi:hypothetical protein
MEKEEMNGGRRRGGGWEVGDACVRRWGSGGKVRMKETLLLHPPEQGEQQVDLPRECILHILHKFGVTRVVLLWGPTVVEELNTSLHHSPTTMNLFEPKEHLRVSMWKGRKGCVRRGGGVSCFFIELWCSKDA